MNTESFIHPIAREGAVCFSHDTHKVVVLETFKWDKKRVTSGYWHYNHTYHPIDANCGNCKFSDDDGQVCTIKMSTQIKCAKTLDGQCGHMHCCIEGICGCNSGGEWERVDGKYWEGGDLQKIFPIMRDLGDTIPVPLGGLCHVYEKKV